MNSPVISSAWLLENLHNPQIRIADCRFVLGQPGAGRSAYETGHIEGAVFLDLESDLSSPKHPDGIGGRHPLPDPETLAAKLGALGIGNQHTVIAYDDPSTGQGFYAAHLWWLLRYLGHDAVHVLDGGIAAWTTPLETTIPQHPPTMFTATPRPQMLADVAQVASTSAKLFDSRAPERYRGDNEPLDRKAGHIPTAQNLFWASALQDGFWKSPAAQRERFNLETAEGTIFYCGSGVSACANLLALELAGLSGAKLYAGGWSDWVSDDSHPIVVGKKP
ncbi:MAG: sulfurtransferase [Deinococcales bacterium]